jgi:beta-1,4-mannosyltransferase
VSAAQSTLAPASAAHPAPAPELGVRAAVFPEPDFNNPYQALLKAALERAGVTFVPGGRLDVDFARTADLEVVHLHWLEQFLQGGERPGLEWLLAPARAARIAAALWVLRRRGVRVVWTLHNLGSHERRHRVAEWLLRVLVGRLAHAVTVHSRYAARRARRVFGRRTEVHLALHSNYIGVYPRERRRRATVRRSLGLPEDAYVYLAFGHVRPYKRMDDLVTCFRSLPDADARLVVAGAVRDPEMADWLERQALEDSRVVVHEGPVDDGLVSAFHIAADAAVLNYRDVVSSGVLMLAFSYGLPVVAPSATTATEIAESPAVEAFEPGELAGALARMRAGDQPTRRRAALAVAEECTWERMAEAVLSAYGVK